MLGWIFNTVLDSFRLKFLRKLNIQVDRKMAIQCICPEKMGLKPDDNGSCVWFGV